MDIIIEGQGCEQLLEGIHFCNVWVKDNAIRVRHVNLEDKAASEFMEKATQSNFEVNTVADDLSIKSFGLLALDMDSTLIELECIDDIAAQYGVGEEVARMTEIAMQGHMPFATYLRDRVKLFAGASAGFIDVTVSHAKLIPGAHELINFAKANGLHCYILSGGFSDIAKDVCKRLGMDGFLCNQLVVKDGIITGEVTGPGGGEILDADGKRRALEMLSMLHGIDRSQAICGGDGANDLEMIKVAGIGFAFHGKPLVAKTAKYRINPLGLDAVINFFVEAWPQHVA